MVLTKERKVLAVATIGKCIDIFETHIEVAQDSGDNEELELYERNKKTFDELYMLVQQDKKLDQKNLLLLVGAINTVISMMITSRENINITIRELDEWSNEIITEHLQNVP